MPIGTWRCVRRPYELISEAPHYAEAFSLIPGRCFRFVSHQEAGGPNHCPEPPTWHGAFRAKGGRRYAVEACDGQSSVSGTRPAFSAIDRSPDGLLVSRQATFALFDACAIKRGWVMVRQRVQVKPWLTWRMRGEVMVRAMAGGLGSRHATYGQGFAGDGRAT